MRLDPVVSLGLHALNQSLEVVLSGEFGGLPALATDHVMAVARRGKDIAVAAIVSMDATHETMVRQECQRALDGHQSKRAV